MNSKLPIDYLETLSGSASGFRAMRNSVMTEGPLDRKTCELVMLGAFVPKGYETAVKVHARRLLDMGVEIQAIRQAILVTFGASATLVDVTQALKWVDEIAG